MIVAAHQTMLAPPALPYDAEVEYLTCDYGAGPYIDTSFVPTSRSKWIVVARNLQLGIGIETSGKRFRIERNNSTWRGAIQAAGGTVGTWDNGLHTHILSAIDKKYWVDSASVAINATLSTAQTIFLFARNNNGTPNYSNSHSLYSSQIYDSGVLVRDFQPVRVGTTGYLFDRVSGQLFGNAGTGAFTIGPDKT